MTLRTDRLELSTLGPDDIDALIAACQDPDIPRYTSVPSPFGRDEAQQLVAKTAAGWASGEHLVWGIRHGAALMGVVGLYRVDGRGSGELGYWLAASARGRGILTEAARAALDWGFAPADAGVLASTASSGTPSSATTPRHASRRRSASISKGSGATPFSAKAGAWTAGRRRSSRPTIAPRGCGR